MQGVSIYRLMFDCLFACCGLVGGFPMTWQCKVKCIIVPVNSL